METHRPSIARHGFTLIEISIVLVIIGLLIAGILAGEDMIHAAKLRAFYGEKEKIFTAINTFQAKYDCLPGDCPNAVSFFGTATSGCPNGGGDAGGACNGNGDGVIGAFTVYNAGAAEPQMMWNQLQLANISPLGCDQGPCVVNPFNVVCGVTPGVNIPKSKALNDGAGWAFTNILDSWLWYGKPLGCIYSDMESVSVDDAYRLDSKYDDGLPNRGLMVANWANGGNSCWQGAPGSTTYTPGSGGYCSIGFKIQ